MQDVASALLSIADRFTTTDQLNKLITLRANNLDLFGNELAEVINSAIVEAQWQINWANTYGADIRVFLETKKSYASKVASSFVGILLSVLVCYILF
jgi:purine-cytosine permease-like protein